MSWHTREDISPERRKLNRLRLKKWIRWVPNGIILVWAVLLLPLAFLFVLGYEGVSGLKHFIPDFKNSIYQIRSS